MEDIKERFLKAGAILLFVIILLVGVMTFPIWLVVYVLFNYNLKIIIFIILSIITIKHPLKSISYKHSNNDRNKRQKPGFSA